MPTDQIEPWAFNYLESGAIDSFKCKVAYRIYVKHASKPIKEMFL